MKINTERGTLERRCIDKKCGFYVWLHDDRRLSTEFAKAIFPVEFKLILAQNRLDRSFKNRGPLAKKIAMKAKEALAEAVRDAECEYRWGARKEPLEAGV